MWAVLCTGQEATRRVRWWQRFQSGQSFFEGDGYDHLRATLDELFVELPRRWKSQSVGIQVALPDPVVTQTLFDFDEFPKQRQAALNLVHWRYAREFQIDPADTACTFQILGRKDGKILVLGLAVAKDLLDRIVEAFRSAGLVVDAVDAMACYQHNYLHDSYEQEAGALVSLAPDQWSLSLWDDRRSLRHLSGFWSEPDEDDNAVVARQVGRIIKGYARSNGGVETTRIHVVGGTPADLEKLRALLGDAARRQVRAPPNLPAQVHGIPVQALMVTRRRCF